MSRWTAVSDLDYLEEQLAWLGDAVKRTCSRCGFVFRVFVRSGQPEDYVINPLCDRCQRELVDRR